MTIPKTPLLQSAKSKAKNSAAKNSAAKTGFAFATLLLAVPALAEDGALAEKAHALGSMSGMAVLASGLAMGIAALGGTLGQSRAAGAALEGIARNPAASDKLQTPMILSLVFIESLVLFTFAIAFLLRLDAGRALTGLLPAVAP